MWNIQGYPWVNVNIDVEFSHHECRSLSERVENPWVFHIHVNVKTLGDPIGKCRYLDKGPLLDKALGKKHLEDPPLTLHLDGWLSHPLEKKK